jgi:iron complex outermembrane receptor protein
MYWQPGGNVHLKPESGWNTDVGAAAFFGSQVFSVDAGVNIYARTIENQILWVSIMGMPSAINARKVNTKGAEYNHTVRLNASELALRYTSQFNFTHAINSESIQHNDNSKNKYVIFVPRISHQHSLACDVQRTTVAVTHQYTGMRYISSDNLQSTDAYHTTNAYLTYRLPINKHQVSTGIHVFNLFNQYYEVMPDRPMPGRNYQFNLTYTFN